MVFLLHSCKPVRLKWTGPSSVHVRLASHVSCHCRSDSLLKRRVHFDVATVHTQRPHRGTDSRFYDLGQQDSERRMLLWRSTLGSFSLLAVLELLTLIVLNFKTLFASTAELCAGHTRKPGHALVFHEKCACFAWPRAFDLEPEMLAKRWSWLESKQRDSL